MSGDNYISSPCVSCIHGINKPYVIELTDCYVFVSMINTNVLRKHKCNATSWSSQRPMIFFMTNYPWNWSHTIKNWSDKLFNYFFFGFFPFDFWLVWFVFIYIFVFLCFIQIKTQCWPVYPYYWHFYRLL